MLKEFKTLLKMVSHLPVDISFENTAQSLSKCFRLMPLWGLGLGFMAVIPAGLFNLIDPLISAIVALGVIVLIGGGKGLIYIAQQQEADKGSFPVIAQPAEGNFEDNWQKKLLERSNLDEKTEQSRGNYIGVIIILLAKLAFYRYAFYDLSAFTLIPAALLFAAWGVVFCIYAFPAQEDQQERIIFGYFRKEYFVASSVVAIIILMLMRDWQIAAAAVPGLISVIALGRKWVRKHSGLSFKHLMAIMEYGELFYLSAYFAIGAFSNLGKLYINY